MTLYNYLIVYSLYGIVWSGYTLSIMLSYGDGRLVEGILFIIIFYFTYLIGQYVIKMKKQAIVTAITGAVVYLAAKTVFHLLFFM
jgi:hypothetical protein